MIHFNLNTPPKICHYKPGDVIHIPAEGEFSEDIQEDELYLVCVINDNLKTARAPKADKSATKSTFRGLYSEERPLFLIQLSTGIAFSMPHLSGRAVKVDLAVSIRAVNTVFEGASHD